VTGVETPPGGAEVQQTSAALQASPVVEPPPIRAAGDETPSASASGETPASPARVVEPPPMSAIQAGAAGNETPSAAARGEPGETSAIVRGEPQGRLRRAKQE
jgi:hypothetical protein